MTDLTVSITKTLSAPIEQVFDAWLDPAMLTRSLPAKESEAMAGSPR